MSAGNSFAFKWEPLKYSPRLKLETPREKVLNMHPESADSEHVK